MITEKQLKEAYDVIAQYVSEDTKNRAAVIATSMGENSMVSVLGRGDNLTMAIGAIIDGDPGFIQILATALLINIVADSDEQEGKEEPTHVVRSRSKYKN